MTKEKIEFLGSDFIIGPENAEFKPYDGIMGNWGGKLYLRMKDIPDSFSIRKGDMVKVGEMDSLRYRLLKVIKIDVCSITFPTIEKDQTIVLNLCKPDGNI